MHRSRTRGFTNFWHHSVRRGDAGRLSGRRMVDEDIIFVISNLRLGEGIYVRLIRSASESSFSDPLSTKDVSALATF